MTRSCGCTTLRCAAPSLSLRRTACSTSAAAQDRPPVTQRGLPPQEARWGSTFPNRSSSGPRELTEAEGLPNVTFVHGDAQVHPFPPAHFDVAISRFGTMFFGDSVAAFANIARALHPRARLVMMVWQAHERNEWSVAFERLLTSGRGGQRPVQRALDPFSRWPTLTPWSPRWNSRSRGRHLRRRPRARLLGTGRRRRAGVGPRVHVHERHAEVIGRRSLPNALSSACETPSRTTRGRTASGSTPGRGS